VKHSTQIRLLALLALVVALLALPAFASAAVGITAPSRVVAGESFAVTAKVPRGTERVSFYIDGRQAAVDLSPAWTLPDKALATLGHGRHVITIRARSRSKIFSARRVVVVAPSSPTVRGVTAAPEPGPAKLPSLDPEAPLQPEIPSAPEAPSLPETPTTPETPVVPEAPTEQAPVNSIPTFNGAKIRDFPLLQAAPGAITEVPNPTGGGETVFQMTVNDQDVAPVTPTENPRAQALAPGTIENGDEFWLQTKFMIPENLPSVPGWMSLVAIYGAPFAGSGPWGIGITQNELRWQRNGTYDWDIPWRAPLVKGKWITVLLHERFATDGWVEMWINGEKVNFFAPGNYNPLHEARSEKLQMATMDASNGGGPNAAKIMQYREVGMFESGSTYFGPLRLGPTRASVGA
jgi:hypothetical protein